MFVTKLGLVGVLLVLGSCVALRCRTEDGPSVEEVKKVVRTCMGNHEEYSGGRNSNRNRNNAEDYDDSDESDSDDDSEEGRNGNHNQYYETQGNHQHPHSDNRRNDGNQNHNQDRKNNNNNNNDRNQQRHFHAKLANLVSTSHIAGQMQPLADYSRNPWPHQNNMRAESNKNHSRDIDNQNSTSKNNQKDNESCMVLCFFKEMKMTNRDGYPDRHKMLHIMTHELRDMQLKDFYTDTIQECHHILEMEQARDKCAFARHLVTCLSERAQTNCEDFQDSFIFK